MSEVEAEFVGHPPRVGDKWLSTYGVEYEVLATWKDCLWVRVTYRWSVGQPATPDTLPDTFFQQRGMTKL